MSGLKTMFDSRNQVPAAFDGHKLQMIIGIIAISLPFVLIIGYSILGDRTCGAPILSAISAYYHTVVGVYFTGILFALAMAMLAYQGVMAIMVAIFPTTIDHGMNTALHNSCLKDITPDAFYGTVHYIAAALLFIALIIFCFSFGKSNNLSTTPSKLKGRIYIFCATGMIFSMIFMALFSFELGISKEWHEARGIPVIIIGETICLILFGVSWLTAYTNLSQVH